MSKTKPFHTSEPVYNTKKSIFDGLPYPKRSSYEKLFMIYLDNQKEVLAYTKVLPRFPIKIPYYDKDGFIRHYIPDFIVKTKKGIYLIETKGKGFEEMETAKLKAEAAEEWCNSISRLTKKKWYYVKIIDSDFELYKTLNFSRLIKAVSKSKKGK